MRDNIQRQILDALLIALRPLARALLRAGIGYREFTEIAKTAFVDIATKDYGLRGRPTNISRVAVMTGLTRKEVRRIRNKFAAGDATLILKSTPMGVILHRWHSEPRFLTNDSIPRTLDFDGKDGSFSDLVRRFGGDIPPGAMRTELKRINAIKETEDGRLIVLKRNVSGLDVHDRLITGLAKVIYPAALTLAHNTKSNDNSETWVHRSTSTKYIRENDLSRIRRISSDRLAEFVESIDDLFVAYETLFESDRSHTSSRAVGIGVFYFEEDKSETDIFT